MVGVMKKSLVVSACIVLGSVLVGCSSQPDSAQQPQVEENTQQKASPTKGAESAQKQVSPMKQQSVTGSIAYRERIALPDNAQVTVSLLDVSRVDAPAEVIATQSIATKGQQVPFAFHLDYKPEQIKANNRYSVRATIKVDGKLRFTTDQANSVLTDEKHTTKLNLMLVAVK